MYLPNGQKNVLILTLTTVVGLSVCLSVTTLAATAIGHGPKVRYHRILNDDFLDFSSQISLRRLCLRDMALFAYHGEP